MSSKSPYVQKSNIPSIIHTTKVHTDDSTPVETKAALDKGSFQYILMTGISGGLAGSSAKTLIAPLDRVKILFQTSNPVFKQYAGSFTGLFKASRYIYQTDGIPGFFQGHSATLFRIFPYAGIKFVAYEQVRRILIPTDAYETSIRRLMSGSIAGLCSVFLTYPLDLIRVRLAFQTKTEKAEPQSPSANLSRHQTHKTNLRGIREGRLLKIITEIYREHPIVDKHFFLINYIKQNLPQQISSLTNFYRGFIPTILGMVPYAGVSFWTHDFVHDILRSPLLSPYTVNTSMARPKLSEPGNASVSSHGQRAPLYTWAQLCAGGMAGMCSQTAAYPFEVIRRRMQVGGVNNGEFIGVKDISKLIWKEKGFKGFYVGLSIGFIKIVPMVACSFLVYERCKFYMGI